MRIARFKVHEYMRKLRFKVCDCMEKLQFEALSGGLGFGKGSKIKKMRKYGLASFGLEGVEKG